MTSFDPESPLSGKSPGPPSPLGENTTLSLPTVVTTRESGPRIIVKTAIARRLPAQSSYGKQTAGTFKAVPESTELNPGDIYRVTYRMKIPFFQKWQRDRFLSELLEDERWEVLYFGYSEEERRIWVEYRALQTGSPVVLLFAAAVLAIAVGIGIFLSVESVEKLGNVETPIGKVNLIGLISASVAGFFLIRAIQNK